MLTTNEVAEILGVKPVSIRVWLNEEGHPRFPNAQKFGRDWQIPESDLAGLPRGRKRGRPSKTDSADGEALTTADAPEAKPAKTKRKKGSDQ
ncbi:MAG: helix-turn-helix domain-containing protein [Acidobacteria bacterium]|nr:helix-turn-helix domain-containing protein [Acidobacteriota bacterium]